MNRVVVGLVMLLAVSSWGQFPVDQPAAPAAGEWKVAAPDVPPAR